MTVTQSGATPQTPTLDGIIVTQLVPVILYMWKTAVVHNAVDIEDYKPKQLPEGPARHGVPTLPIILPVFTLQFLNLRLILHLIRPWDLKVIIVEIQFQMVALVHQLQYSALLQIPMLKLKNVNL